MRRFALRFVISACVAGCVATVQAKYLNLPFAGCLVDNYHATKQWFVMGDPQEAGGGLTSDSVTYELVAFCPFIWRDTFTLNEVNTINVHVYDGHTAGSVYAQAVWVSSDADTMSEGDAEQSSYSNTGYYSMDVDPTVFDHTTGWGYVSIQLPLKQSKQSVLRGVYFSDT